MKLRIKLCIGILAFGLCSSTAFAKVVEIKNWTTIAALKPSELTVGTDVASTSQGLYILPLDKDIINLSKRNDLSDIRIIDADKNEIPYVLVKSNQNTQIIQDDVRDVTFLENSLTKDGKKILVLDTKREGVLYNSLYLMTDSASINFRKKVKVFISDTSLAANSTSWREFEQRNVIYNYTDAENFSVNKTDINLSGVSSRHLKIELTDDTTFNKNIKVGSKLNIVSAQVKYIKGDGDGIGFTVKDYLNGNFVFENLAVYKEVNVLDVVTKDERSEITLEGDIDVEVLILKVGENNKNFKRAVVVQGSNDDAVWSDVASGNVYRIDSPTYKGESLTIPMPISTYKKFRVIIQNNNDKALDISKTATVKLQNTGVLFALENAAALQSLQVITGNNTEPAPIYDIRTTINYFESSSPRIIGRGDLTKNPSYEPAKQRIPFAERNKVYLNIGLLIVVFLLGIFGFFWMKKESYHE